MKRKCDYFKFTGHQPIFKQNHYRFAGKIKTVDKQFVVAFDTDFVVNQGIIRSFKHYYDKQLVKKKIIFLIDHKCFHDATLLKVNVLNAMDFIAESWHCVLCTIANH